MSVPTSKGENVLVSDASFSSLRVFLIIFGTLVSGTAVFLALCLRLDVELPVQGDFATAIICAVLPIVLCMYWFLAKRGKRVLAPGVIATAVLTTTGTFMVLSLAYKLKAYISLPVDLLSYDGAIRFVDLKLFYPLDPE